MGRNTRGRGALRRSVAHLAVLALMTGGALAAFAGTASAHRPSCDDEVQSARHHHFVLVCKDGPDEAVAGTNITYTLDTFSSTHQHDDHAFLVTDDLPAGTTLVDADGGESWDCSTSTATEVVCTATGDGSNVDEVEITLTVHVDSSLTEGVITNCSTMAIDPVTEDAAAEDYGIPSSQSCVDSTVIRESDPSIVKTGPGALQVPGNAVYTVTATNNGPSDSDPVSFTDPIPAGTTIVSVDSGTAWDCTASTATQVSCTTNGGIAAGDSTSVTITLSVPISQAGSALQNCATLTSNDSADVVDNNQSCTTVAGANVTVKAAEAVVGIAPKFTG